VWSRFANLSADELRIEDMANMEKERQLQYSPALLSEADLLMDEDNQPVYDTSLI
jgi:hypothetical protein